MSDPSVPGQLLPTADSGGPNQPVTSPTLTIDVTYVPMELQKLQNANADLLRELSALERVREEKARLLGDNLKLENLVKQKDHMYETTCFHLKEARSELAKATQEISRLTQENDSLRRDIEQLKTLVGEQNARIELQAKTIQTQDQDIQGLRDTVQTLEGSIQELRDTIQIQHANACCIHLCAMADAVERYLFHTLELAHVDYVYDDDEEMVAFHFVSQMFKYRSIPQLKAKIDHLNTITGGKVYTNNMVKFIKRFKDGYRNPFAHQTGNYESAEQFMNEFNTYTATLTNWEGRDDSYVRNIVHLFFSLCQK